MTSVLIPVSEIRNFACSDERITCRGWRFALVGTTHRDATAIDESNHEVICDALRALDPEERHWGLLNASSWAVGWMTHVVVDPSATALVARLEAFQRSLADYAILDEMHCAGVESERHDEGRCDEHCLLCESEADDSTGGYCDCACRDCFETAIGKAGKALCHACQDAGCEANDGECQRDDAYGEGES